MLKINAKVGMQVVFGRSGERAEKSIGKIIKINPTKAKVELLEERGTHKTHTVGTVFLVPYDLMEPHTGNKEEVKIKSRNEVTITPGVTTFRSIYADSNALWKVIRSKGQDCWLCEIQSDPVTLPDGRVLSGDYVGTQKVFMSREIAATVGLSQFWAKQDDQNAKFYATLSFGQTVHYQNNRNAWVRTIVVQDKGQKVLKPIALVGTWATHDLPKRQADGSVYMGYHGERITKGETFKPNYSHLWEGSYPRRPDEIDPNTLMPINLELPPMTAEEQHQAKLYRTLQSIYDLANRAMTKKDGLVKALEEIKVMANII